MTVKDFFNKFKNEKGLVAINNFEYFVEIERLEENGKGELVFNGKFKFFIKVLQHKKCFLDNYKIDKWIREKPRYFICEIKSGRKIEIHGSEAKENNFVYTDVGTVYRFCEGSKIEEQK